MGDRSRTFVKIKGYVDEAITIYLGVIMFAMAIIVFTQVVARYVFNNAIPWPEEVVRAGVVWTTFLGSYAALVRKKEIRFNVLLKKISGRSKYILSLFGDVLTFGFLVVVLWQGILFVEKFAQYKLPMTNASRAVVYVVFPIGAFFMLIHISLSIRNDIQALMGRTSGTNEPGNQEQGAT
jgi:TRAP-type C4-dicarboxylate transport system permease small subunit